MWQELARSVAVHVSVSQIGSTHQLQRYDMATSLRPEYVPCQLHGAFGMLLKATSPKGPCRYIMVYTWAFKGLLYHEFGAHVGAVMVLGPFV